MNPILLATDGSPTAEEATKVAIELAKEMKAELLIMTAWDVPYGALGYSAVPVGPDLIEASKEQAEKVAGEAVHRARAEGVRVRSFVVRGFPAEEICETAKTLQPALIVMGSHGWGSVKRTVFGSVSTSVLHHTSFPVLVVPAASGDGAASGQEAEAKVAV